MSCKAGERSHAGKGHDGLRPQTGSTETAISIMDSPRRLCASELHHHDLAMGHQAGSSLDERYSSTRLLAAGDSQQQPRTRTTSCGTCYSHCGIVVASCQPTLLSAGSYRISIHCTEEYLSLTGVDIWWWRGRLWWRRRALVGGERHLADVVVPVGACCGPPA